MKFTLSERMRASIWKAQQDAKASSPVLDVYKTAREVQKALPEENLALEDIVTALLSDQMRGFEAFELHRRDELLEIRVGTHEDHEDVTSEAAYS